jgi:hypothetical protein
MMSTVPEQPAPLSETARRTDRDQARGRFCYARAASVTKGESVSPPPAGV